MVTFPLSRSRAAGLAATGGVIRSAMFSEGTTYLGICAAKQNRSAVETDTSASENQRRGCTNGYAEKSRANLRGGIDERSLGRFWPPGVGCWRCYCSKPHLAAGAS